jgi:hypothetical protein
MVRTPKLVDFAFGNDVVCGVQTIVKTNERDPVAVPKASSEPLASPKSNSTD